MLLSRGKLLTRVFEYQDLMEMFQHEKGPVLLQHFSFIYLNVVISVTYLADVF
jgi:hypothetical protein